MKVLGIESSCDETAIAIVNEDKHVYTHQLFSQIDDHIKFGGVVPEIASRKHLINLPFLYAEAIKESGLSANQIDAIAVTSGPGLIGGLLVGVMFAKGLAYALNKPIIAVNHLEGHALTARFACDLEFPYLMLLISGGHCQILIVEDVSRYALLGSTMDDSVGEAFDKVARMLGLGYPGGPAIEKCAKLGDENKYAFNMNVKKYGEFDFSFSGLKSSVKRLIDAEGENLDIPSLCASFQKTVASVLTNRALNACKAYAQLHASNKKLILAGGVAANQYIVHNMSEALKQVEFELIAPPIKLCTDNGIMIAWAGLERYRKGLLDSFDFEPRSRWPLNELKR